MFEISQDKKKALNIIIDWFNQTNKKSQFLTLGGHAGTGKSTFIAILREEIAKNNDKTKVAFVSFTGKATRVLNTKLNLHKTIKKGDFVGTIHSLLYSPLLNDKEEIIGWKRKDSISTNLIIIDEASMVDQNIWQDLLNFKIPILAVGDHGQLPPINDRFNLMKNPDLKLETIHRQAKENPIIELSIQAREHGSIFPGNFGQNIKKIDKKNESAQEEMGSWLEKFDTNTLILCGYNSTRIKLNQHLRELRGFENPQPSAGDRVICLRNNYKKNIFNGMLGTIYSINQEDEDWFFAEINMDEEEKMFKGLISAKQFNSTQPLNFGNKRSSLEKGDLFDFGYALTVHKAQGSQAKRVILFEERFPQMNDETWKKWLYTGITRAEKELIMLGD